MLKYFANFPVANLGVTGITKGTEPVGVSRRVYNAWAQYAFQRESLKGLSVGLGANYRSEAYADVLNQSKCLHF